MTTGEALLDDIIAHPDDDTLRLIYADWLEEHGNDPDRAEFIQVQVAIDVAERDCWCGRRSGGHRFTGGQHHNGPCAADQLRVEVGGRWLRARMRERELFNWNNLERWGCHRFWLRNTLSEKELQSLPEDVSGVLHRRGFVHTIRCPLADFLERGQDIARQHPVERVEVTDRETNGAGVGFRWWSRANFDDSLDPEWWLPSFVFDRLAYDPAKNSHPNTNRIYPDEASARTALSDALLLIARR